MIELRDVSKTVMSGSEPLTILHPLSMQIPHGQFVAIVGPSGSGKSTLLGLIAGLDAPSSGAVLIDDVDITRLGEDALAKKYHVPLVPFLLANVAGIERLNQRDGIHPTAEGDRIVADNVWAVLKPIAEARRRPNT